MISSKVTCRFLCLCLISLFHCGAYAQTTSRSRAIKSKGLTEPEQVALRFYQWYLPIYNNGDSKEPPISLVINSGQHYQIDDAKRIAFYRQSGFFSLKYLQSLHGKYAACNREMEKVSRKEADACGCSPAMWAPGNACNFLSYFPWINGQGETVNKVAILEGTRLFEYGAYAVVYAVLLDATMPNSPATPYSYPVIRLEKRGAGWAIVNIEFKSY
jgi:hypothetical protein